MEILILVDGKEIFSHKRGIRKEVSCVNHKKFSSVDFAKYLDGRAKEMGKEVNLTKMQKWLYICYGSYLVVKDEQLFTERPKAWDYGPAFPDVYYVMKFNSDTLEGLSLPEKTVEEISNTCDKLVTNVLNRFGSWSAGQLVAWTHRTGTAWHKKYEIKCERYTDLEDVDIVKEFERYKTNGIKGK